MQEGIDIGSGVSREKDPNLAVKEAVQQAREGLKDKIELAIVFSSINFAYSKTAEILANLLGPTAIIGATGAAIISHKGIFRNGLAVTLLSFPKTALLNTALVKEVSEKGALKAGSELGEKLLSNFSSVHRDLGLIFSDGLLEEGSNLIYGLQERLGTSFPIIGASASDNLQFLKTYIYFNRQVIKNAACGIIWGGKLNFSWGTKHGWKPLGKPRYVTKSKANIVYEIDNAPAVKVYEEYLARNLSELRKELKRVSIFYPVGIRLPGEQEYLLRNIHSFENDGSLVFQGNVPEGSFIRLMIGTKDSCLAATQQAADEVKQGLAGKRADLVLVFDSVSRYTLLGRGALKELNIIKNTLGEETPISGIYTYGEQAPLMSFNYHGRTHFHNQTITMLGIKG